MVLEERDALRAASTESTTLISLSVHLTWCSRYFNNQNIITNQKGERCQ